jgi:hypothetical protein
MGPDVFMDIGLTHKMNTKIAMLINVKLKE